MWDVVGGRGNQGSISGRGRVGRGWSLMLGGVGAIRSNDNGGGEGRSGNIFRAHTRVF